MSTNTSPEVIIDLKKVALQLGQENRYVDILHDIDLKINSGQTTALMGPSGSGKTSLLMLIGGLETPSAGEIHVCGEKISHKNEDELAEFRADNVGIVFQSFHLIPTMTALENVSIPLEFKNRDDAKIRAKEALVSVGLGDRMDHYPAELSGGEQQRVAIARAFVTRPKLLMADEPTGNLDQETGSEIMKLLFDLHDEYGTTLLLVTHDQNLADQCQHTIRIKNGRIE